MNNIEYILCHGSGNRFVMIDAVESGFDVSKASELMLAIASKVECDGLLILDKEGEGYAMRMYNTDGTAAAMCGNGMRCVARLADERYISSDNFTLYSGGGLYPITRSKPLAEAIPCYGVDIAVRLCSDEFPLGGESFIAKAIPELEPKREFTFLNLGNPHIIAKVSEIDYQLLEEMGERVKELKEWFPNGVNVSLVKQESQSAIFVATFERGVGLTASCGTAMTASTTTMALLGHTEWGEQIEVRNRGGFVKALPRREGEAITTQLLGNATYIESGVISAEYNITPLKRFDKESAAWEKLIG